MREIKLFSLARRVTPLTRASNILELLQITLICWLLNFPNSNMGNPHILIAPDYQIQSQCCCKEIFMFCYISVTISDTLVKNNIQLLDETEQNIVIYQWRADQLFADAEGRGK